MFIGSEKLTVATVLPGTFVAPFAGVFPMMLGAVLSAAAAVVNDQT